MKTFTTLALIMALLGFPAVNASAGTFTLWDYFPQNDSSPYGFHTGGFNDSTKTLTDLIYTSDYNYSLDGAGTNPVVKRAGTAPWIKLKPSETLSAVLYGIPPETNSLHIYGDFALNDETASAYVTIGKALWSDPSNFTQLFNTQLTLGSPTAHFDLTTLIDPSYALVFDVSDAPAYLKGTIEATAVPVPASLLLLGSGLLGLAGWRRRPWLK